jgi:hypothetical protein
MVITNGANARGAGANPLLGSANTVHCQVRLGLVRLDWVRFGLGLG